jgi:predicted HTH transcriptional regulator
MIKPDDIQLLLKSGESQTVEFKSTFDRDVIETLVAFANTQGGTVLVGVADDGSVKGITIGKESLNEWLGQIKLSTSPSIIPDIDKIKINEKIVVAIRVGEYPVKPINTKGKYFRRVASSNHQLTLSEITDMYMQSYPEVDFAVEEIGGGTLVTFNQTKGVSGSVSGSVNGSVNEVFDFIRKHPGVKVPDIKAALDLSTRTVRRRIKELKEKNIVAFIGADKTGGYYITDVGKESA